MEEAGPGLVWTNVRLLLLEVEKGVTGLRLWERGCLPGHRAGVEQLGPGGMGMRRPGRLSWEGAALERGHPGLALPVGFSY